MQGGAAGGWWPVAGTEQAGAPGGAGGAGAGAGQFWAAEPLRSLLDRSAEAQRVLSATGALPPRLAHLQDCVVWRRDPPPPPPPREPQGEALLQQSTAEADPILWGGAHYHLVHSGWLPRGQYTAREGSRLRAAWGRSLLTFQEEYRSSSTPHLALQAAFALSIPGAGQGPATGVDSFTYGTRANLVSLPFAGFPFSASDVARWLEGRYGHCALNPCFGYANPAQLTEVLATLLENGTGCESSAIRRGGGDAGGTRVWGLTREAAMRLTDDGSSVDKLMRLHEKLPRLTEVEDTIATAGSGACSGVHGVNGNKLDRAGFQLLCWTFCLEEMVREMAPNGEWVALGTVAARVRSRGVNLPRSEQFVLDLVGEMVKKQNASPQKMQGLLLAPTPGAAGGGNVRFGRALDIIDVPDANLDVATGADASTPGQGDSVLTQPQSTDLEEKGDEGSETSCSGSTGDETSQDCVIVHTHLKEAGPRSVQGRATDQQPRQGPLPPQSWCKRLSHEMEAFGSKDGGLRKGEMAWANKAKNTVMNVAQKRWPGCKVELFGSRATGLHLTGGDVDLVVLNGPVQNLSSAGAGYSEKQRRAISKHLNCLRNDIIRAKMVEASQVQLIKAKKVPILKCTSLAKSRLECDISMGVANGLEAVKLTKDLLKTYPPLRPLMLTLKLFLKQKGMNAPFTGGIGAYTLLNMVVALLMTEEKTQATCAATANDCGYLLLRFFEFYGEDFDYANSAISIASGGIIDKSFQWFNPGKPNILAVEDPQQKGNDIGKNSFMMPKIVQEFKKAAQKLRHHAGIRDNMQDSPTLAAKSSKWAMVQSAGQHSQEALLTAAKPGSGNILEIIVRTDLEHLRQGHIPSKWEKREQEALENLRRGGPTPWKNPGFRDHLRDRALERRERAKTPRLRSATKRGNSQPAEEPPVKKARHNNAPRRNLTRRGKSPPPFRC